jgi:hypothetical protein
MKKIKIYLFINLFFYGAFYSCFSQIEIHDNGKVTMGGLPSIRPICETFVNGSANGDAMYVQHRNFTAWSNAINVNLVDYSNCSYNLAVNNDPSVFYVYAGGSTWNSWVYCNHVFYSSDSTLKKNIYRIPNALGQLKKLNGYNFHYKSDVLIDKGVEKGKTIVSDTFMHAGFLAQEIQRIAPYAVTELKNGKLGVDYIQMVPFLLEGIKELDAKNNNLSDQLNLLQSRFNKLAESIDTSGGNYKLVSNKTNSPLDFILYQNSPNPFNHQTSISYTLKGTYSSANIYIFDLQGSLKKSYTLNGSGSLTVKGNELNPGMYLYSLVVDGKEIDTKRMILTN